MPLAWLKGSEKHDCRTLAEISDSCIKHGFKMSFFIIVFSLQPIHLSSYEIDINPIKVKAGKPYAVDA